MLPSPSPHAATRSARMPHAKRLPLSVLLPTLAARLLAEKNDKSLGAIASAETAKLYNLKVLEANINKSGENTTRFAVLSKVRAKSPAMTSSVVMFTVKHEAGSLANAIIACAVFFVLWIVYTAFLFRRRIFKKHYKDNPAPVWTDEE